MLPYFADYSSAGESQRNLSRLPENLFSRELFPSRRIADRKQASEVKGSSMKKPVTAASASAQDKSAAAAAENRFPPGMKVFIRRGALYLQPTGGWSADRGTAEQFGSSTFALWWAKEHTLMDFEIVLAFANPSYDFAPLNAARPDVQARMSLPNTTDLNHSGNGKKDLPAAKAARPTARGRWSTSRS